MTTYVETLTLSDGTLVEMTSTRTPQQRARFEHLCRLFGCWERPELVDERTAHDWQQARDMAAERAQRADDAALYNEGRGDYRDIGH